MEVQIRTTEMDNLANYGIAAHWLYKTSEGDDMRHIQQHAWLRNLIEVQQRTGSSEEFLENVKVDLFPDEVYVFTPKGDIIELPAGATVLDLAYAIHTDIGHQAVGKVDGQFAPLSAKLNSGKQLKLSLAKAINQLPTDGKSLNRQPNQPSNNISGFSTKSHSLCKSNLKKAMGESDIDLSTISDDDWGKMTKAWVKSKDELLHEVALG